MTPESAPWLLLVGGQRSATYRFLYFSQRISSTLVRSVLRRWDVLDPWTRLIFGEAVQRKRPSQLFPQPSLVNSPSFILQSPEHYTLPSPRHPQMFQLLSLPPLQPTPWLVSTSRSISSGMGVVRDATLVTAPSLATGDLVADAGPASLPTLLLVHPRYRGVEDRKEALRLAESLVGRPCPFLEVGGSRLRNRRPREVSSSPAFATALRRPVVSGLRATYFGSGTMVDLAQRLDELETTAESGSGSGSRTSSVSARQRQQRDLDRGKEDGTGEGSGGGTEAYRNIAGDGGHGRDGRHVNDGDNPFMRGGAASGSGSGSGGSAGGSAGGSGSGYRATAFINEVLTPLQERNIEVGLNRPVMDRVGLILRLFAQRAHTREARLQVELASLSYMLPRLVRVRGSDGRREAFGIGLGWGGLNRDLGPALQVVSARQRGTTGAGGLGGGGGSGDPELRQQRFRIKQRLAALRAELKAVAASRGVQRQGRRAAGLPTVAIVGYTNVGKTSLAGAMCSKDAGLPPPTDMLFATLDPAVRRAWLPTYGSHVAVSDTVGFIRDLPVGLVAAFRATLEEVVAADMIVHVLDASSPNVAQQRDSVLAVLQQLGISEHVLTCRTVEVWNKVDLLTCQPGHQGTARNHNVQQLEDVRRKYGAADAGDSDGGSASGAAAAAAGRNADQTGCEAADVWHKEADKPGEEGEEEGEGVEGRFRGFRSFAAMCNVDSDDGDDTTERYSPPYGGLRGGGTTTVVGGKQQPGWDEQVDLTDDADGGGYDISGDELGGKEAAAAAAAPFLQRPTASGRFTRRLFPQETQQGRGEPSAPAPAGPRADGGVAQPRPQPQPQQQPGRTPSDGELSASPIPIRTQPPSPSSPHLAEGKLSTRGFCYTAAAAAASAAVMAPPSAPSPPELGICYYKRERRNLHSAADKYGNGSGTMVGSEIGSEAEATVREYDAATAGEERGGAEANWLNPKSLAAAADLVRLVQGSGSCVPAAVVLTAVAEDGGGVEEVKAAVDAVLRTISGVPPQQHAATQSRTRVGCQAIEEAAAAAADGSVSREPPVAALAGSGTTTGRWVTPLLWLADGVLWPLPPPPPPSASYSTSKRWRGVTRSELLWGCRQRGAPFSGTAVKGVKGADVGGNEAAKSPSSISGRGTDLLQAAAAAAAAAASEAEAGDWSMTSSRLSFSSWHERASFPEADVDVDATGRGDSEPPVARVRWPQQAAVRYDAQLPDPAAAAAASDGALKKAAVTAAGLPDDEELEELIHFLRRRRPRRENDE
ncbi:hypothetical protein VaNZ11_011235 [Volvox africanus]|uniref:Hflx-type G domain-containing protein n=1 Tax=Volvox africanus TaxID=51714 RepID=A0ABQ5SC51_9CHLO|nr:hypothetical protein VaNZ11_011235 [Volvox africanus]